MKKFIFGLLISCNFLFGATDSDNDLVPDHIDLCPNTPAGVFVDLQGCTKELVEVVNFSHNSAILDIDNTKKLQEYIKIAKEAFGYDIVLKGHTDASGDHRSNLILSHKRVLNVMKIFQDQGVETQRIFIKWYGETQPIATNVTSKGRELNRRVEIILQ